MTQRTIMYTTIMTRKRIHPKPTIGTAFGDWTIVGGAPKRKHLIYVSARCSCGITVEMFYGNLTSGRSTCCRECGKRRRAERMKRNPIRAKIAPDVIADDEIRRRWLNILNGMKSRCYDTDVPAYHYYGGRGIEVCIEWHDQRTFLEWVAQQPGYGRPAVQIDRMDNDCGYSPGNCRLVTPLENARNRTNRVLVEYHGEVMCASELREKYLPEMSAPLVIDHLKRRDPYELILYYHTVYLPKRRPSI